MLLVRVEEYATQLKHNRHNWEMYFAPINRQRERLEPVVDLKLRQWAEDTLLTTLPSAPPLWPAGKVFALYLTYDVDVISASLLQERLRSLRPCYDAPERERTVIVLSTIRELVRSALFWRSRPDPPLDTWFKEEDGCRFRSTFAYDERSSGGRSAICKTEMEAFAIGYTGGENQSALNPMGASDSAQSTCAPAAL